MPQDLEISCPKCGEVIRLDETLAGPMISRIKANANKAIKKAAEDAELKVAEAKKLETRLAAKERELADREGSLQAQVNRKIAAERPKIAAAERENLLKELSPELEAERARAKELQEKLTTAKKTELQLRQEKDAVDQRAKDIDLEVAQKVDEGRKAIHEQASKAADEAARLRLAEKDKTISDMQLKLEEAQRKATQGSQQLQGDVLEIDFESILRRMFPQDTIEPVKTGVRGGDILQRVLGEMGRPVGTVFWETKRAQAWGGEWATKAKQDAADAKAEIAIIVSEVLPKGVSAFGIYDGVWCSTPAHATVLAVALRQGIISTAEARQGSHGRETKKDRLYDYMIGPQFRATVEGIALPFRELSEELVAEKRATQTRWRRQEKRIERVLTSIASLQGDLQGIAGNEMLQLPGFELESGDDNIAELSD